jgi:hypothetical protein
MASEELWARLRHGAPQRAPRGNGGCGLGADGAAYPLRRPSGALGHLFHRETAQREAPENLVLGGCGKALELKLLGSFHGKTSGVDGAEK